MRAVWYEENGPAAQVLTLGERPDPEPGPGEVRVRIAVSGLNPRDVKRRSGVGGRAMTELAVIPGDDGAGVIDRVGAGIDPTRLGEEVWVHSATYLGPYGTCAEFVVLPATNAVPLPPAVGFDVGACLGVPALTAHRCLFDDTVSGSCLDVSVDGKFVLVTGGAGAVGNYAIQLAKLGGATVVATASTPAKQARARQAGADLVIDYRSGDATVQVLDFTNGRGVDRVIDVDFAANLPFTRAVTAVNGTIVAYSSNSDPYPSLPFYELMRCSITIRTVLVFQAPPPQLERATAHLGRLLAEGSLEHPIDRRYPLAHTAAAHAALESGEILGKVLIEV